MDFSSFFIRDPSFSFLNAGTLSRTPLAALEFMEGFRRESEKNPTLALFSSFGHFWEAQKELGAFLHADPAHLFFRSNVTAALNDFFFALRLERGGEILATGLEYGATANIARLRAERGGAGFRVAPLPLNPHVTAAALERAVIDAISPATKVLLLSHVATGTGTVLPVATIAREARRRGIVVVVDGAHAPGAIELDIPSLDADFYGGNLHKWFMGPTGTAFGWVNPRAGAPEWQFGGWATYGRQEMFAQFGGDDETVRRLFPGTMDPAPFAALGEVFAFWRKHGAENIRARQHALRDLAARRAEAAGWERVSPRDPALLGPLVSFRQPAHWPALPPGELATKIYHECKVQLALPRVQGESLVRFSPAAYGTEAEIEAGFDRLLEFGK